MLRLLPKPSLEEFISTCTPLAIIPSLEADFQQRVADIASALLQFKASNDPVENLAHFLQADKNFLGIILALTNLSQEKFLQILSAERFANQDFESEWTTSIIQNKIRREAGFAERIASLFLEGRNSDLLIQHVASFYLDQVSLPIDWHTVIHDPERIYYAIRTKLAGEYSVKKGAAIEARIRSKLDQIQQEYGVSHGKGQVQMVAKEVDHAIPSTADPYIMIMTSYMETTSSSQTARANEQREMYLQIQSDNIRYGSHRVLVNFVDGAGWLARRSDLRKMYAACDFIINLNTLNLLEAIICKYAPDVCFTISSKPVVEE